MGGDRAVSISSKSAGRGKRSVRFGRRLGRFQEAVRTDLGDIYKGRKRFCFGMERRQTRPENCSVGKLLSNSRFREAVLKFLRNTGVGKIKEGVVFKETWSVRSWLWYTVGGGFLYLLRCPFPLSGCFSWSGCCKGGAVISLA